MEQQDKPKKKVIYCPECGNPLSLCTCRDTFEAHNETRAHRRPRHDSEV